MLAEPTSIQREAFELLGVPIRPTLKQPEQNPPGTGNGRGLDELTFAKGSLSSPSGTQLHWMICGGRYDDGHRPFGNIRRSVR